MQAFCAPVETLFAAFASTRAPSVIGKGVLGASRRLIEFFSLSHTKEALRVPPTESLAARGYAYTCAMV